MRIISGNLKGKKLFFSNSKTTRPLRDLVKESIFNVIIHSNLFRIKIENSFILDLYSGIGSFGLEAISRGASNVCFVENQKETLNLLKKNIKSVDIHNKTRLFAKSINDFVNQSKSENEYDIIFCDPPFAENHFINELKLIQKKKIYKKKHLLIIHREESTKDNLEGVLRKLVEKKYGKSKIIFAEFLT